MTLGQLKQQIEHLTTHEGLSDNTSVLLATQPGWPFEHDINDITLVEDEHGNMTVYMEQGAQLGHLNESAQEVMGW